MNGIIDIAEMEKQFKDEWLLFEVLETDEQDQPLKGRLICHHPDRDYVHQKDMETRYPYTYVTYTGPVVPEGIEAALWSY
jgi:hypothetical protein